MGREVRRVPKDWVHPRNERSVHNHYIPLYEGSEYRKSYLRWLEAANNWESGFYCDYSSNKISVSSIQKEYPECRHYEHYNGKCPSVEDYMPDWAEEEKTHYMMYETTSEGTPISPAMETIEELARWLADNKASVFGRDTATYEEWLAICKRPLLAVSFIGEIVK